MNILRLTYFRNEYFFAWKKRLLVKSQSIFLNQGKIYRTDVLLSKIQKDRILQSFFISRPHPTTHAHHTNILHRAETKLHLRLGGKF